MKPSQQDQPNPRGDPWPAALPPPRRDRWFLGSLLALLLFLILFVPMLPAMAAGQTIFGDLTPTGVFTNAQRQLGLQFKSAVAGQITAIRFYRVAEGGCDTVAHTGYLYNESGTTVLASVAIPASTT